MNAKSSPAFTPYQRIIMEEFSCTREEAYAIERKMRDIPGCGTLDHLSRAEVVALARRVAR